MESLLLTHDWVLSFSTVTYIAVKLKLMIGENNVKLSWYTRKISEVSLTNISWTGQQVLLDTILQKAGCEFEIGIITCMYLYIYTHTNTNTLTHIYMCVCLCLYVIMSTKCIDKKCKVVRKKYCAP